MAVTGLKLNTTNIKSPFKSSAPTAKISAGASSFISRPKSSVSSSSLLDTPDTLVGRVKGDVSVLNSVQENEKKISLLKSIVKTHQSNHSKERELLGEINSTLQDIGSALSLDFANRITLEKSKSEQTRKAVSKAKFRKEESGLEKGARKIGGALKTVTSKALAPVQGMFGKIWKLITTLGTGILVNNVFKWLEDPKNVEKVKGWFNWMADNWKWMLAGIGALAALSLVGPLMGIFGALSIGLPILKGAFLLLLNPLTLKIIAAIAAGILLWKAGSWVVDKVTGRKTDIGKAKKSNKEELEAVGLQSRTLLGIQKWSVKSDKTLTGWTDISYDDMNEEQKAAVDKFKGERTRINDFTKARNKEIRATFDRLTNERESMDNPEWAKIMAVQDLDKRRKLIKDFRKETQQIVNDEKKRIRAKYNALVSGTNNVNTVDTVEQKETSKPVSTTPKDTPKITGSTKNKELKSQESFKKTNIVPINLPAITGKMPELPGAGGPATEAPNISSTNGIDPYRRLTPSIYGIYV